MPDKRCFVASPIGEAGSDVRRHADQLLEHVIRPIAQDEFGYDVVRSDEMSTPGSISTQVIEALIEWELVIGVLSFHNPNVFYEIAVRHAFHEPFIHMIREGDVLPFDVRDHRTIRYVLDLDGAPRAAAALRDQITAVEAEGFRVDNPIATAARVGVLAGQGDPTSESLAIIQRDLSELAGSIRQLESGTRLDVAPYPSDERDPTRAEIRNAKRFLRLSQDRHPELMKSLSSQLGRPLTPGEAEELLIPFDEIPEGLRLAVARAVSRSPHLRLALIFALTGDEPGEEVLDAFLEDSDDEPFGVVEASE